MQSTTILALSVRVVISLLTRTYFQPDEYFQSLEPAHHLVFGYGHLTWEWLTHRPIRSIFFPLLNVPLFWLLNVTGISESGKLGDWLLILGPKVIHGLLAACTDIYLVELTRRTIGDIYISSALLFSLTCFFHALALSRSLSNSLETSLSTIAFSFYPWDASSNLAELPGLWKCILFSSLCCMVRPTNAVIWVFLYANLLWSLRFRRQLASKVVVDIVTVVVCAIAFLFLLDSAYYKKPTFTPVNFLRTNLSSVSLFYGANPWHYYVTQGIPILCTTCLPFTLHGIWKTLKHSSVRDTPLRTMLKTAVWSTTVYSFGGHKEWRFLHPLLPLMHIFAAKSLVDISSPASPNKRNAKSRESRNAQATGLSAALIGIPTKYILFILLTVPISLYVVLFYRDAPISVLSFFRALPPNELCNSTVGFLMPCHSTPGFTYLHRKELANGGMWSLGCEPPLQDQLLSDYQDQTAVFFEAPVNYLKTYFPSTVNPSFPPSPSPTSVPGMPAPEAVILNNGQLLYPWKHEWPRHLVFFGDLLTQQEVRVLLEAKGYKEIWQAGRKWEGEDKRLGGVRIWKWQHSSIRE